MGRNQQKVRSPVSEGSTRQAHGLGLPPKATQSGGGGHASSNLHLYLKQPSCQKQLNAKNPTKHFIFIGLKKHQEYQQTTNEWDDLGKNSHCGQKLPSYYKYLVIINIDTIVSYIGQFGKGLDTKKCQVREVILVPPLAELLLGTGAFDE